MIDLALGTTYGALVGRWQPDTLNVCKQLQLQRTEGSYLLTVPGSRLREDRIREGR